MLTKDRNDLTNGAVSTTSPLGSKLLGTNEEDEIEFEANGRVRQVMVVKVETSASALAA